MKRTFEAAIRMAGHTLKYGKRKLSPQEFIQASKAYKEIVTWFNFYQSKLTDNNIQQYIAKHSDKLLLIIPANASGKSLLDKLNVKP